MRTQLPSHDSPQRSPDTATHTQRRTHAHTHTRRERDTHIHSDAHTHTAHTFHCVAQRRCDTAQRRWVDHVACHDAKREGLHGSDDGVHDGGVLQSMTAEDIAPLPAGHLRHRRTIVRCWSRRRRHSCVAHRRALRAVDATSAEPQRVVEKHRPSAGRCDGWRRLGRDGCRGHDLLNVRCTIRPQRSCNGCERCA
jgi:hypothetical protein